jgi:antitoxin (DNA-binding transcriptional repressor) of toxin-antitoxin stability system
MPEQDIGEHRISEAEARDRLPELIDRALAGERVQITREGERVAELCGSASSDLPLPKGRLLTQADLEWLDAHRVGDRARLKEDAGKALSRMRDEDWR